MDIQFSCQCGGRISEFTRGDVPELSAVVQCDECDTAYALTITRISRELD